MNAPGETAGGSTAPLGGNQHRIAVPRVVPPLGGVYHYQVSAQASDFLVPGITPTVYWPNVEANEPPRQLLVTTAQSIALSIRNIPASASQLVIVVDGGVLGQPLRLLQAAGTGGEVPLTLGVPAGNAYRIRVAAISATQTAILRTGQATAIHVPSGGTTQAAVHLRDITGILDLSTPFSTSAGSSVVFRATITDPGDTLSNPSSVGFNGGFVPLTANAGGEVSDNQRTVVLGNQMYRFEVNRTMPPAGGSFYYQFAVQARDFVIGSVIPTVFWPNLETDPPQQIQLTGPTFALSPAGATVGANGGLGTVQVVTSDLTSPWAAVSNDSWITIIGGGSMTGGGTVTYLPAANTTGSQRIGSLNIGGIPFLITQLAVGGGAYTISPAAASIGSGGGTITVNVTGNSTAPWNTVSNVSWIAIVLGGGTGPGPAILNAASYNGFTPRIGTVTIAGNTFTVTQAPVASTRSSRFVGVAPCRIIDTRDPGRSVLAANSTSTIAVAGTTCGIPLSATAFSLNITVVPAAGSLQFLTIWPAGQPRPTVSTLNSFDGRVVANAAIVPAGVNGSADVFVTNQTHLIIDINGYFDSQSALALPFFPVTPCRVADTRNAAGAFGGPVIPSSGTRDFPFPLSGCAFPANAAAYSTNVTAVPRGALSYLSVYPLGGARPLVSTLNSFDGGVVANAAIVRTGDIGGITVFVTDTTDVILDANGYFAPSGSGTPLSFYPVTPCRVSDTRNATGIFGGPVLQANSTRAFPIPESPCAIPADARAYSLNVTVVPRGPLSFLTLWPAGVERPLASTLNSFPGRIVANAAIVPAGAAGSVNVYVTDASDVILDINGYFAPQGQ